jgi:hypothetical protein
MQFPVDWTIPAVAPTVNVAETCAGLHEGCMARSIAAAPATWGEAIEVPLRTLVAVFEVAQSEVIWTPGAYRSTQGP